MVVDRKVITALMRRREDRLERHSDKDVSNKKYKDMIIKKMEEKYSEVSFSLSSLADEMDLSSGYLSFLFKNLFGIPF